MLSCLYDRYGCYYWCPEITLNAIGDDMPEILRLMEEILIEPDWKNADIGVLFYFAKGLAEK